jgi:hypothetical protein
LISGTLPTSTKKIFKDELSATLRNAEAEKPQLNSLLDERRVSSVDLFDVHDTLTSIASELAGQGSHFSNWGNEQTEIQLAQLGAKAGVLGAKIGLVLRQSTIFAFCSLYSLASKLSS